MATPPPLLESIYREIGADLGEVEERMQAVLASDRPAIAEMVGRAYGYGGKRLRPALVLLTAQCAGKVTPRHVELAAVVELVHLATLVHDDIIDEAQLRRRVPTVNASWSNHEAVLLGDIIFSRAINLLARMGDRRSLMVMTAAVSTLCEGEILQNRHRHDVALPEEEYYEIIRAKTGALFGAGCELAAWLADASDAVIEAFTHYGAELGLAFQIIDDCLDIAGDEHLVGKSLGTDLQGGKMTLPLILLRERLSGRDLSDFEALAAGEHADAESVRRVRELLTRHGCIDEAMGRAQEHINEALASIRPVVAPDKVSTLEAVASFVTARKL